MLEAAYVGISKTPKDRKEHPRAKGRTSMTVLHTKVVGPAPTAASSSDTAGFEDLRNMGSKEITSSQGCIHDFSE